MVNALTIVAVPPPGALFVTEMLRAPIAPVGETVIFAVTCVGLLTVSELRVMSEPKSGVLTPFANPVPVMTTSSVFPSPAAFGDMLVNVGTGFPVAMVNPPVFVAVPPPGVGFVTETSRAPVVAPPATLTFTVICVELFTVILLIVIPVPEKLTELAPLRYPVPVRTISKVWPWTAVDGETVVIAGTGKLSPAVQRENEPMPVNVIVFEVVLSVPPL